MLPGPSVRLRLTGEEWPAAAVENGNVSPVRAAGPRGVARGRAAPESDWLRWTRATGCGARAQERERRGRPAGMSLSTDFIMTTHEGEMLTSDNRRSSDSFVLHSDGSIHA